MAYNVISCKKSPETLKKSKALISLCNLGSRAQKSPKRGVAEAHIAQFPDIMIGMAYIGWHHINPHVQRVQKKYDKEWKRVIKCGCRT